MTPVLEARGITKRFPGVVANDKVNFTLEKGEIHSLLGENGAGKTTLMNVVYSLYQPDEGKVLLNGQEVHFHSPDDAIRLGIGMVHQHFMLVPVMTVTENIMLGVEETRGQALVTAGLAAVIGGGLGYLIIGGDSLRQLMNQIRLGESLDPGNLLAGIPGLIFWVAAVALYLIPFVRSLRLRMGATLFGAISGAVLGAIFEAFRVLVLGQPAGLIIWPLIGILIGAIANLRWMDKRAVAARIRQLSEEYGLNVDPDAMIVDLPVGSQQRVEIIKALYRNAQILILDEPTAVLTPQEADDLFKIMRRLTTQGVSIIFITHKLREVMEYTDRITVLRRGKVIGTITPEKATQKLLAQMMVGREVLLQVEKGAAKPHEVVLSVENLQVVDDRRHLVIRNVSLDVRAGEIVGIAGVQGNGQTELIEAITGLREIKGGYLTLLGHVIRSTNPRMVTGLGTAHIPEDRHRYGLVLSFPVADNLILADYHRPPFSHGIVLDEPSIRLNAEKLIKQYDIRTPGINTMAGGLSGGNQQKVIVARELSREPKLLIANQPTRGLDVGSIEFIHNQIVSARDGGAGILLVSAELEEIISLSDRIMVMFKGQIVAEFKAKAATPEQMGLLMAGAWGDDQSIEELLRPEMRSHH